MVAKKKPVGASVAEQPKAKKTPVKYSRELALAICERLSSGESLRTIAKDDSMPNADTFCRWLTGDAIGDAESTWLGQQYARARERQADHYAAEIIDIADDNDGDMVDGSPNPECVARSRLRIDARKWYASKLAPKRYGDKIEHSGTGAGGAIIVQMSATDADL